MRVEFTLSREHYELLKKAQSYISHIIPENDLAAVVTYLAKSLIQKKEGRTQDTKSQEEIEPQKLETMRKPKNSFDGIITRGFGVAPSGNQPKSKASKRKYISIRVRRQVFAKADYCCEHINPQSKTRCKSKYQLQVDHRIPLACGGINEIENLRALCGNHNRQEALRWGLTPPRLES